MAFTNYEANQFIMANKDDPYAIIQEAQRQGINNPAILADLVNRVAPEAFGGPISAEDVMYAYNQGPKQSAPAPAPVQQPQQSLQQMAGAVPTFDEFLQSMGVQRDQNGNWNVGHEDNMVMLQNAYQQALQKDQYGRMPSGTNIVSDQAYGILGQSRDPASGTFTGQDGKQYLRTTLSPEDFQRYMNNPQEYLSLPGVSDFEKQAFQHMYPYAQNFAKNGGNIQYDPTNGYYIDKELADRILGPGVQSMPSKNPNKFMKDILPMLAMTFGGPFMQISGLSGMMPNLGISEALSKFGTNISDMLGFGNAAGDAAWGVGERLLAPGSIWNDMYNAFMDPSGEAFNAITSNAGQSFDPTNWKNIGRFFNPLDEIDFMDAAVNLTGANSFPDAATALGYTGSGGMDALMKAAGFTTALTPAMLNSVGNGNGTNGGVGRPGTNGTSGGNGSSSNPLDLLQTLLNGAGGIGSFLSNLMNQSKLKDTANQAAAMTDPFGPERPFYQQMLRQSYTDPNFFSNNPVFKGLQDEAQRRTSASMASQGFNQSGNMLHETARTAAETGFKYALPFQQNLGVNAGANIGPGYAGFLQQQGTTNSLQAGQDALAGLFTGIGQLAKAAQNSGVFTPQPTSGGNNSTIASQYGLS